MEHALIIGGSSGIGLAAAALLAKAMKVTIAGRDTERLAAARAKLVGEVDALSFDATDASSRQRFFERIGPFDHLVMVQGSHRGLGPLATLNEQDVAAGFAEKVWPHLFCTKAALPHLSKTGSITFLSAVSAHAAIPGTVGIGAANAAIAAFVPILAVELRPIRVNAVSPGVVDTPWWDFVGPDQKAAIFADAARRTPVGRNGTADDIAAAIAFVVSNGFTSGQVLICDGGARLGVAA